MYPVLFTVANFPVTSFGFLLFIAYLFSLYVIWRLTNVYGFDKEKVLDLYLIGTVTSVIGARLFYFLQNRAIFHPWSRIFTIAQYPGFDFWGGFLLATFVILLLVRRFKLQFWQVADIAIVGLIAGLIPASLGCLLGSCHSGYPSTWPIAVTQVGLLDKRFPIQIVEGLSFILIAWYLWHQSLKFHFVGKIALIGLILLAIDYFTLSFWRPETHPFFLNLSLDQWVALGLIIIGSGLYYSLSHRSAMRDFRQFFAFFSSSKVRTSSLSRARKSWYTQSNRWHNGFRRVLKKTNVKATPTQFRSHQTPPSTPSERS